LLIGALASTRDLFPQVDDEKPQKNRHMHDQLPLSAAILTQWWRLVASTKALDLLNWAIHAVLYRCTAKAIKTASKVGPFFHLLFAVALVATRAIPRE
jgi:hypothetical protein